MLNTIILKLYTDLSKFFNINTIVKSIKSQEQKCSNHLIY